MSKHSIMLLRSWITLHNDRSGTYHLDLTHSTYHWTMNCHFILQTVTFIIN